MGEDIDEASLLAAWSDVKTNIDHLREIGDLHAWNPDDPRNFERLRATLRERWIIVTLFPGPLTYFTERRRPPPVSRSRER